MNPIYEIGHCSIESQSIIDKTGWARFGDLKMCIFYLYELLTGVVFHDHIIQIFTNQKYLITGYILQSSCWIMSQTCVSRAENYQGLRLKVGYK